MSQEDATVFYITTPHATSAESRVVIRRRGRRRRGRRSRRIAARAARVATTRAERPTAAARSTAASAPVAFRGGR